MYYVVDIIQQQHLVAIPISYTRMESNMGGREKRTPKKNKKQIGSVFCSTLKRIGCLLVQYKEPNRPSKDDGCIKAMRR
jgi:hypothetical protein